MPASDPTFNKHILVMLIQYSIMLDEECSAVPKFDPRFNQQVMSHVGKCCVTLDEEKSGNENMAIN